MIEHDGIRIHEIPATIISLHSSSGALGLMFRPFPGIHFPSPLDRIPSLFFFPPLFTFPESHCLLSHATMLVGIEASAPD